MPYEINGAADKTLSGVEPFDNCALRDSEYANRYSSQRRRGIRIDRHGTREDRNRWSAMGAGSHG